MNASVLKLRTSPGLCPAVLFLWAGLALSSIAQTPSGDPVAVPVGKGSYASFPPEQDPKKSKDVNAFLTRELFIDESQKSAPVPTNDWWTDLIYDRYAGNMWAYP